MLFVLMCLCVCFIGLLCFVCVSACVIYACVCLLLFGELLCSYCLRMCLFMSVVCVFKSVCV